jgi:cephalosporin-C deacetylase
VTPVDSGLRLVDVFDVHSGFGGHPIKAWLTRPAAGAPIAGLFPEVGQYNGYRGGRGLPHEHVDWAASGYVHLFMDTRGQGSRWGAGGDTPDPVGAGPATPGFMTRGLLAPAVSRTPRSRPTCQCTATRSPPLSARCPTWTG